MDLLLDDRVRGVLFGQAVGDALGLGAEFMTKAEVREYYPQGLTNYDQIIRDRHRSRWRPGEWTDDTDQMLCILDSVLERKRVDASDISQRFLNWAVTSGRGMGRTTRSVMLAPQFLHRPHRVARMVWEQSGKEIAPNGGVMRTSVLGIWEYDSPARVKSNAEHVCTITHYDPRCVGSSVAVSLAISSMLRGDSEVDHAIDDAVAHAIQYDSRMEEYFDLARLGSIEGLNLGDQENMGYTLKTMAAGFWALKNSSSFSDGLLKVINEGGDADTNGTVAGALLGARFGLSGIPQEWVNGLVHKDDLARRIDRFLKLL